MSTGQLNAVDLFVELNKRTGKWSQLRDNGIVDRLRDAEINGSRSRTQRSRGPSGPRRDSARRQRNASPSASLGATPAVRLSRPPLINRVAEFVSMPVPPYPSAEGAAWDDRAKALGRNAYKYLLTFLLWGNTAEQYAALVALRALGYEAWGEGYGNEITYRVRMTDTILDINPDTHEVVSRPAMRMEVP